jgi:hypothetical protein
MPILSSSSGSTKGPASAPTVGTATVTNSATVSLAFTVPSFSKLPITSYTVTSSPSIALSTSGTSTPLTVTGSFAQGQAYTFTIIANHANGSSTASSASNSITPYPAPVFGNWTAKTSMVSGKNYSLWFGAGLFIAPQSFVPGNPPGNYGENVVQTSSDGNTWTQRNLPSTQQWRNVVSSGTIFVIVTDGANIATSPDGITWTARTYGGKNCFGLVWNGSIFAATGYGTTLIDTSPDGINWTARTGTSAAGWGGMAWGNGIFLSVSNTSNEAQTSPDGITWTARTMNVANVGPGIAWNGSVFFVPTQGSATYQTTTDGITWTTRTAPSPMGRVPAVAGSMFLILSGTNFKNSLNSTDAITWTERTRAGASNYGSVNYTAYGNGMFMTTGGDNTVEAITYA